MTGRLMIVPSSLQTKARKLIPDGAMASKCIFGWDKEKGKVWLVRVDD